MVQDVGWSSSHHSYLQKVGWKQKTKGIHQGVLLEATTQSFHSHPTGQNLATGHIQLQGGLRTEYLLWVTVCDIIMAWWRVDIEEGKPAVSAMVCL